jgi:hypothetical protein
VIPQSLDAPVVFCLMDDFMRDLCRERRLPLRCPKPVQADSEVLTIEIVGEFLGLDTDRGLHAHFRRHFGHRFPGFFCKDWGGLGGDRGTRQVRRHPRTARR